MENLDPVFQEFADALSQAAAAHVMALAGIRRMHEYWTDRLLNAQPPTTASSRVNISTGDPRDSGTVTFSAWRLGDLPALLAEGGPAMIQISQQWAVSVYTEWEEHYRGLLTGAARASEPLRIPVFGDLRRFRNDIVHHRGVATVQNSGRCDVLTHWFDPGDLLYFDTPKVAEFMSHLKLTAALPVEGWGDAERVSTSGTRLWSSER